MNPDELIQLAIQHHQAGRLADAEKIYRQILTANPNQADALHLLGVLAGQAGQAKLAVDLISRAIAAKPDHFEAQSNLAYFLIEQNRFEEAVGACNRSIAITPYYAGAHNNLGQALVKLERHEQAITACNRAIAIDPNCLGAFTNLGNALRELDRVDEAMAAFDKALKIDPRSAATHNNVGLALARLGKHDDAIAAYRRAIAFDPNLATAFNNLGKELNALHRFDEAIAAYRQGITLKPDEAIIHWNLALALLTSGNFAEGWNEFEWGNKCTWLGLRWEFSGSKWTGQDLRGKTLLLHCEAGFGDSLQFIRFVPLLQNRGAKIILQSQPELFSLFSDLPGVDSIIHRDQPLPKYDFHISLPNLPRIFKSDLTNISSTVPYLKVPPATLDKWRPRLKGPGPKVGLVWMGTSHHTSPRAFRMPTGDLLAHLAEVKGVHFYSLQKGRGTDIPLPPGLNMIDLTDDIHDFSDTAALVQLLDLVVSVDTSVAHLAGALARPVWMLLPFCSDWRWLTEREDSPWYPTLRLFRQSSPTDISGPVNRLVAALKEFRP